jgi:hypothetical protein
MLFNNWVVQHLSLKRHEYGGKGNPKSGTPFPSCPSSRQKPKRGFLDLPAEIRLLIYEAIFTPASVVLQSGENPGMIAVLRNFPELISRGSRDVQLFRTCRTCHDEAVPIFYSSLNLLVYQHLPLLRSNFLPKIGAFNASFIKRAIITPIGLPGEHQRFLECLGPKHGGLVGLESLTLEIWNLDHVPALISTCQELMQHHEKLKILFGRGTEADGQVQAGDIPARLKMGKLGKLPGHRVSNPPPIHPTPRYGRQAHIPSGTSYRFHNRRPPTRASSRATRSMRRKPTHVQGTTASQSCGPRAADDNLVTVQIETIGEIERLARCV